ncbi:hypothetical protein HN676_01305 [Candidatus Woesearchaeota archaeon]|nr:hypothetical protein [Candidatus Woesearchaeota archaeon]
MNDLSVIKYNNINELKKTNNNLDYYLDEVIADFYENNNKKSIIYAQILLKKKEFENKISDNQALFLIFSDILMQNKLNSFNIANEEYNDFKLIYNNSDKLKAKEYYFFNKYYNFDKLDINNKQNKLISNKLIKYYTNYNELNNNEIFLFQILVSNEKIANDIYSDLLKNKNFKQIYNNYKINNIFSNFGFLGKINLNSLDKNYLKEIQNINFNKIHEPFKTDLGWIIFLKSKDISFDQFKLYLNESIVDQLKFDLIIDYKQNLINSQNIIYKTNITASFIN